MDGCVTSYLIGQKYRMAFKGKSWQAAYDANNRTIINTCEAGHSKFIDRIDGLFVKVYCLDVLTNTYSL